MSDRRALIVDDEPDIRELLGITLGRMGVQASPAANIAEALALLRQENFDLCLTDMRLPDGNGLDLVADIARRRFAAAQVRLALDSADVAEFDRLLTASR